MSDQSHDASERPHVRRWGVWVVVGVVLVAVWLAEARSGGQPAWWVESRPSDARVVRNAEVAEGAVMAHVTAVRGDEGWSVSLAEKDACDWLAARMPMWLESRGVELPEEVRAVRVAFRPEGVYVGAEVAWQGRRSRIAWVLVEPRVDERGLWMRASRAGVGDAAVPLDALLGGSALPERVRDAEGCAEVLAVLRGERPAMAEPVVKVDGARQVRLVGLAPQSGAVVVTARTVAAP
jgi:hypothetical protein